MLSAIDVDCTAIDSLIQSVSYVENRTVVGIERRKKIFDTTTIRKICGYSAIRKWPT